MGRPVRAVEDINERFRRRSADGAWDRLPARVQQHSVGAVDWTVVCVDRALLNKLKHKSLEHPPPARRSVHRSPNTSPNGSSTGASPSLATPHTYRPR
jgi:hypothetical protein